MAWLFLTPVFYPVENVPDCMRWMLTENPLHHLISAYRAVLLDAASPLPMLVGLLAWTILLPLMGLWFFRRTVENVKDFL